MKIMKIFYILMVLLCVWLNANDEWPILKGPYLGQEPPGMEPVIFAEKFITSKHRIHGAPAFSPVGNKLYFYSRRPLKEKSYKQTNGEIWYVEKKGDKWNTPRHLTIDMKGDKLFFSLSDELKQG